MSDIVERLTALSEEYRDHDPDVVAFTAEAAAEITRLRDHAAGLALERDGFQEECKRLRAELAQLEQESDAEIALLRDYLASAERHRVEEMEERHRLAREVARLRAAMSREDGPQYLANLLMEAEAALLSAAQQRDKAEGERDTAKGREQRMREFAEYLGRIKGAGVQVVGVTEGIRKRARAALGEPQ